MPDATTGRIGNRLAHPGNPEPVLPHAHSDCELS